MNHLRSNDWFSIRGDSTSQRFNISLEPDVVSGFPELTLNYDEGFGDDFSYKLGIIRIYDWTGYSVEFASDVRVINHCETCEDKCAFLFTDEESSDHGRCASCWNCCDICGDGIGEIHNRPSSSMDGIQPSAYRGDDNDRFRVFCGDCNSKTLAGGYVYSKYYDEWSES